MNSTMMQTILIIIMMLVLNTMELINDYEVDVRCGKKGINVRVAFKKSFRGIIFSKGFYNDRKCRYVENGSGIKIAAFGIPFNSCGTEIQLESLKNVTNTIMIQRNNLLETWRDTEVTLSCQSLFSLKDESGTPEMDTNLDKSSAMIWMEIKSNANDITTNSAAYVGDTVSVIIYIKDDGSFNDVAIGNCRAQNNLNISSETKSIELLDNFGCSTSEKLLSSFNISTAPDGNFIAASFLNVFRFTDQDDLYLSCSVELCEDICYKFCPRMKNADKIVKKRSISFDSYKHSNTFDFNENKGNAVTRKLMYLTMNTLASRLRERRLKMNESPGIAARNLALDDEDNDEDYKDSNEYVEDSNVDVEDSNVDVEDSNEHVEDSNEHVENNEFSTKSEKNSVNLTELFVTEPFNLQLTVIKKLKVLPPKPKAVLRTNETASASNECFPKIRFTISIVFFSLITLCLLITTILMACYIRSERKRSKINNFLLYSYR